MEETPTHVQNLSVFECESVFSVMLLNITVMSVNINEFGFLTAGSTVWALRWLPFLLQGILDHQALKRGAVEITGK